MSEIVSVLLIGIGVFLIVLGVNGLLLARRLERLRKG